MYMMERCQLAIQDVLPYRVTCAPRSVELLVANTTTNNPNTNTTTNNKTTTTNNIHTNNNIDVLGCLAAWLPGFTVCTGLFKHYCWTCDLVMC